MDVYEFRLEPQGAFRHAPRAPGLFGQLAWTLRYANGSEALEAWLAPFIAGNPSFLISSAFPTGYLPRPKLPSVNVTDTNLRKGLKDVKYVSLELFRAMLEQGDQALVDHFQSESPDQARSRAWEDDGRTRVSIDRRTGGARQGALFDDEVLWFLQPPNTLSVYVKSDPEIANSLLPQLRQIGELGYAGKSSIGLGQFTVSGPFECTLPAATNAGFFTSLSPVLPSEQERGWWEIETYWGRLGAHFAHAANPFKKPHFRFKEGSTLMVNTTGGMLDTTPNPAPENGVTIYDYLYAFPLGIEVAL